MNGELPPDALDAARERMTAAKARFSKACAAVLAGERNAPLIARLALAEIEQCRGELARLADTEER